MNERRIAFFIDDDSDFLQLIPDVIRHPHFEIRTYHAANGYRTIDEIIKVKPDVLFIDFNLPRVNGGQILPILKSVRALAHLPIYFMTGYPEKEVLPFLKDVDHSGLLLKGSSLKAEVLRILDQWDHAVSI